MTDRQVELLLDVMIGASITQNIIENARTGSDSAHAKQSLPAVLERPDQSRELQGFSICFRILNPNR